jgi:hypothetical protein
VYAAGILKRSYEMNEDRKAALIERYRDINVDHDWWEHTYEDFERICTILGIELHRTSTMTPRGRGSRPDIEFSGFWSQGDGASWTGAYRAREWASLHRVHTYDIAPAKIREHAPNDEELHRIADELCLLARIYYPAYGVVERAGRYSHSGTMRLAYCEPVEEDEDAYAEEVHTHVEETLTQLFRDLADWLYAQLEREYEHLTSDESVWDTIQANELDEDEEEDEDAA